MTAIKIKKEFETYLPLLTIKQQALLLDMVKNILNVAATEKRISVKQYNKELDEAESRIAKGKYKTHEQAQKVLSKW